MTSSQNLRGISTVWMAVENGENPSTRSWWLQVLEWIFTCQSSVPVVVFSCLQSLRAKEMFFIYAFLLCILSLQSSNCFQEFFHSRITISAGTIGSIGSIVYCHHWKCLLKWNWCGAQDEILLGPIAGEKETEHKLNIDCMSKKMSLPFISLSGRLYSISDD